MNNFKRDLGSFKDPAGFIIHDDSSIYRIITKVGLADYKAVRQTPVIRELIEREWLLDEKALSIEQASAISVDAASILMHPKIPFISYPYEWTFSALKQAALRHLAIQQHALIHNVSLVDASAYNIQFLGASPIFIDHLSFRPYKIGEFWLAHQQFCDTFLNPLLLKAYTHIDYQAWYRGSLNGISTVEINRLLPWYRKFNLAVFVHVVLPAHFEKKKKQQAINTLQQKAFSKQAYLNLLIMLENCIKKLVLPKSQITQWQTYAKDNHYQAIEKQNKLRFIRTFIEKTKPKQLWDLGCNSGDYAIAALKAGAEYVIGMDTDIGALENAYERAKQENYNFLPLHIDCMNPTPAQGWANTERYALQERTNADAIMALAIIHHLALSGNVSLSDIIDYLLQLAPMGVLEFVPKQDPMVKLMLAIKGDIFPDYHYDNFINLLSRHAEIIQTETITEHGRVLIWYEKKK
ncbi:MAG: nodulation protein NoeA [Legionellales bacterium]|nr:nodulation protein NoeA [Legionellales bacterium]